MQRPHGLADGFGAPAHVDVLGDLQRQPLGRHAPVLELAPDGLGQVAGAELRGREIHRHPPELHPLVQPVAHLGHRPVQGDLAQGQGAFRILEGGEELAGQD